MPRIFRATKRVNAAILPGFNEAGAFCPGYLPLPCLALPRRAPRFNEAGAFCPGYLRLVTVAAGLGMSRFNEAGAFCPGYLQVLEKGKPKVAVASMRPGHFAPDIYDDDGSAGDDPRGLQ